LYAVKHIKQTDGFFGLYRGVFPRVCANLSASATYYVVGDVSIRHIYKHKWSFVVFFEETSSAQFLLLHRQNLLSMCARLKLVLAEKVLVMCWDASSNLIHDKLFLEFVLNWVWFDHKWQIIHQHSFVPAIKIPPCYMPVKYSSLEW